MARTRPDNCRRITLRLSPGTKTKLARAAALLNIDLTDFVTQSALREADAIIQVAEPVRLTARDHVRVFELLDNPPSPNTRLREAMAALPYTL